MSQFFQNSQSSPPPPTVATSYVTNNGTAVPAANVLNVVGGTGASTSGSGSTITVTVTNEGFTWTEQSGPTYNIPVQNGVFCNAGMTVNLPATAGLTIGNTVIIYVDTTSQVIVQANTGQMIQVSNNVSAAAGTATSALNFKGSILELVFKPSDTTWHTQSSMGSWAVV